MSGRRRGATRQVPSERVQTGIRMRRPLLKAIKALAEYYDLSGEELVEHVLLASLLGVPLDAAAQARAAELMRFYGVEVDRETLPVLAPRGGGAVGGGGPADVAG
jgi:hypothetical protein